VSEPPVPRVHEDASSPAAHQSAEKEAALDSLARLILESFMKVIPQNEAAAWVSRLKTKAGKKEFADLWPIIVDAYFDALRNPKKR
jgi:hypothetical protein